jgi:hypothetical protein
MTLTPMSEAMADVRKWQAQLDRAIPRQPAHMAPLARNIASTLRIYTAPRTADDDRESARAQCVRNIDYFNREKARAEARLSSTEQTYACENGG